MKQTIILLFLIFAAFTQTSCKNKETKETMSRTTFAVSGNIVSVGPHEITIRDKQPKDVLLRNVTNIDKWAQLPKIIQENQMDVTVTYKITLGHLANPNDFTITIENIVIKR